MDMQSTSKPCNQHLFPGHAFSLALAARRFSLRFRRSAFSAASASAFAAAAARASAFALALLAALSAAAGFGWASACEPASGPAHAYALRQPRRSACSARSASCCSCTRLTGFPQTFHSRCLASKLSILHGLSPVSFCFSQYQGHGGVGVRVALRSSTDTSSRSSCRSVLTATAFRS